MTPGQTRLTFSKNNCKRGAKQSAFSFGGIFNFWLADWVLDIVVVTVQGALFKKVCNVVAGFCSSVCLVLYDI